MTDIILKNLSVQFGQHFTLEEVNWVISPGQHWAVCGGNGAGKSALTATLDDQGEIIAGTIEGIPEKVSVVSYEAQAELIEAERKKDDADILDVISEGTPVQELLDQACSDKVLQHELVAAFNIEPLLGQGFRKLSSGESRKMPVKPSYFGMQRLAA